MITREDLKKLIHLNFVLPFLAIVAIFFIIRLINLTLIPVFVDEAIYIRWSQVMRAESTLRFLPLQDGKQPLFMWFTIPFLKVVSDPLFAGRLTSIFSGLFALLGLSTLTFYITRSKASTLISALLYTIVPYTFFFDRLSLVDTLLSAFAIWSIFLGILFVSHPRLDLSMILGIFLGLGLITKSPGVIFLALQPVFLLTLKKPDKKHLLKIALGWVVAFIFSQVIYNILRLGPNFHMLSQRNYDYVFPFSEVLTHPLNPLEGNLKRTFLWYISFLTWPILASGILAISLKTHRKYIFTLSLWIFLPLIFQASIAKVYTARYILYTIPPFLLLSSLFLSSALKRLKRGSALALLGVAILVPSLKIENLLTNPAETRLPQNEKHGYFQEWTAGYGQKEVADYIIERSKSESIVVGTEGFFGSLPDGLQIYTEKVPNITIFGIGHPVLLIPDSLKNSLENHEVYLVLNQSRNMMPADQLAQLELIKSFDKPKRPDGTNETLLLYKLKE